MKEKFKMSRNIPTNEQETIVLFERLSEELGYQIVYLGTRFPDGRIKSIKSGAEITVEFEYKSSNYLKHRHPFDGCDLIVCWDDDLFSQLSIPVLSLSRYISAKEWQKSKLTKTERKPDETKIKLIVGSLLGLAMNIPFIPFAINNRHIFPLFLIVLVFLFFSLFLGIIKKK